MALKTSHSKPYNVKQSAAKVDVDQTAPLNASNIMPSVLKCWWLWNHHFQTFVTLEPFCSNIDGIKRIICKFLWCYCHHLQLWMILRVLHFNIENIKNIILKRWWSWNHHVQMLLVCQTVSMCFKSWNFTVLQFCWHFLAGATALIFWK